MAKKERDLSITATEILEVIKNAGQDGLLYSDIKALVPSANPSQLTALASRDLINAEKVNVEVQKVVKTKVNKYFFKGE